MKRKMAATFGLAAVMMMAVACGSSETKETETAASAAETGTVEEVEFNFVLADLDTDKYVTLGEYKGLEISEKAPEVTEEEENSYIDYILSGSKTNQEVDRAAKDGDVVNIDYEGKKDGVAFEGGAAQGYDLTLGSGSFIDGFEEGLIGAAAGDTKELNLTFPETYNNKDLAGQDVVFTVKVNKVQEAVTPELTDDFVTTYSNGEMKTVEEFRKRTNESLMEEAQRTYDAAVETKLIDAAVANCEFAKEMPEDMVEGYLNLQLQSLEKYAQTSGMTLEDMLTNVYGATLEEFKTESREGISNMVQQYVMMQAIANKEGIVIDEAVVNQYSEDLLKQTGYTDIASYKEAAGINDEALTEYAMVKRVLQFLKENAKITDAPEEASETETAEETVDAQPSESAATESAE